MCELRAGREPREQQRMNGIVTKMRIFERARSFI
jgi:hypothetical protein